MAHWTDDATLIVDWYIQAAAVAASDGNFGEVPAYNGDFFKETVATFMEETRRLTEYNSPSDALDAFRRWVAIPAPEPTQERLGFEMTKHYGAVSVTFSYRAAFTVPDDKRLRRAFALCEEKVNAQFEAFERYSLSKIPAANNPSPRSTSSPSTSVSAPGHNVNFIGRVLAVEYKDNKLYYKVKGGQYEKFGVRVWPEVLSQAGVTIPTQPGEFSLGRECTATVEDGKVGKVIFIA